MDVSSDRTGADGVDAGGNVTSLAWARDCAQFCDAFALRLGEEMSPSRQQAFSGVLQSDSFAPGESLAPVRDPGLVAAEDVPFDLPSVPTSTRCGRVRSWLS